MKKNEQYEINPIDKTITLTKKMTAIGGTVYNANNTEDYTFMAANGNTWGKRDIEIEATRGDGSMIVCHDVENGYYGIFSMNGDTVLSFYYRNRPVLTDDGKVILQTTEGGFDPLELTW